jgi:hypothetical protein
VAVNLSGMTLLHGVFLVVLLFEAIFLNSNAVVMKKVGGHAIYKGKTEVML